MSAPRRISQHALCTSAAQRSDHSSQQTARANLRRGNPRGALDNALLGWIAVAVALSIGSFYALVYVPDPEPGDSMVTAWVGSIALTLALGPIVLCAALAHRELRRWWAPIGALAIPALLGVYFILN